MTVALSHLPMLPVIIRNSHALNLKLHLSAWEFQHHFQPALRMIAQG